MGVHDTIVGLIMYGEVFVAGPLRSFKTVISLGESSGWNDATDLLCLKLGKKTESF